MLVNYDDATFNDIQIKAKTLRDDTGIDVNTRLNLWKETVHVRRKIIRDKPTLEILEEFPGYKDPVLVGLFIACFVFVLNIFISLIDF
jgi:hypothetical protein